MKPIHHKEYILIEVGENKSKNSQRFRIIANELVIFWNGFLQDGIKLPPGQYEIIGKGNEIRDVQWEQIVDLYIFVWDEGYQVDTFYKNYQDVQQIIGKDYSLETATESGLSLLAHHKLKPETTLILKTTISSCKN